MIQIQIKKSCTSCKAEKPLTEFHKSSGKSKDGYHSHCKICRKERNAEFEASPKRRWSKFLNDAKRRNIKVEISFKDFLGYQNHNCFYCNKKIKMIRLDRINSDDSYNVKNIVSCCSDCNYMKNSMNLDNFLSQVEKIYMYKISEKK